MISFFGCARDAAGDKPPSARVDPRRIVAIVCGHWSEENEDYQAILVFDAGGRLATSCYVNEAHRMILEWRISELEG